MDSLRLQFLILLVHIFEEDREVVSMNHFLFGSNLASEIRLTAELMGSRARPGPPCVPNVKYAKSASSFSSLNPILSR